jgi:hypothetical protein
MIRSNRWHHCVLLVVVSAVGCGAREPAGLGLSPEARLVDLEESAVLRLCQWASAVGLWSSVEESPGETTKWMSCGAGRSVGIDVDTCVQSFSGFRTKEECIATVSDFMVCEEARGHDPCSMLIPVACDPVVWGCWSERSCATDRDCGPRSYCNREAGYCRLR